MGGQVWRTTEEYTAIHCSTEVLRSVRAFRFAYESTAMTFNGGPAIMQPMSSVQIYRMSAHHARLCLVPLFQE